MKIDANRLQDLARIATAPELQPLREHLAERLRYLDEATRNATGDEIVRSQGRALGIAELLSDIEQAAQQVRQQADRIRLQARRPIEWAEGTGTRVY